MYFIFHNSLYNDFSLEFHNHKTYDTICNLIQINNFLKKNKNKIDKIDLDILKKNNLVNRKYNKLKILGLGECNEKIQIEANFISSSAKQKIEKMGGSITLKKNK